MDAIVRLYGFLLRQGMAQSGSSRNSKRVLNSSAELKTTCSISYADCWMSALVELNSPGEYRPWLISDYQSEIHGSTGDGRETEESLRGSLEAHSPIYSEEEKVAVVNYGYIILFTFNFGVNVSFENYFYK